MMTSNENEADDLRNVLGETTATAKRIVFSHRLRQAWQLTKSILAAELTSTRDETPPPARRRADDDAMGPANLEDPLKKVDEQLMVSNWGSQHSFGFLPELTPAQGPLHRFGREW